MGQSNIFFHGRQEIAFRMAFSVNTVDQCFLQTPLRPRVKYYPYTEVHFLGK